MAKKVDVSQIPGYEDMTVEEKLQAVLDFEVAVPDPAEPKIDVDHYKSLISKANSEAAKYKKQYQESLTEKEQKELEQQEAFEAMRAELETLKQEKVYSTYLTELLGLGYDDKLAKDTAQAMTDGDTTKVFANQKKFKDNLEKQLKADLLKSTPRSEGGAEVIETMSKDEFEKLTLLEKQKVFETNPELFEELTN